MFEKIVIVTRKTRLASLIERFNSRAQAKFYIEHSGGDFTEYDQEDQTYQRSLEAIRKAVGMGLKIQVLDREIVPTYLFCESDIILTVGQDGLVANTAKYVGSQPILAVNPDPQRFDGILLPFTVSQTRAALERVVGGTAHSRQVTLGAVQLGDGQKLLAFNDFFIGARSHVSARYQIRFRSSSEPQSSSGLLISTGAGSTGWFSSVLTMAAGVSLFRGGKPGPSIQLEWEDPRLLFVVREPFLSRHSKADLIAGRIESGEELTVESQMPSGGVIFSDGVEADHLDFNSGAIATISAASQRARLVVA